MSLQLAARNDEQSGIKKRYEICLLLFLPITIEIMINTLHNPFLQESPTTYQIK